MAKTYYISDALNTVARQMQRNVEDAHGSTIANNAISKIWMRYDWRESIAELPPFYVIPNIQDYGAPQYAVPTDLLGLRDCYLLQVTSSVPFRYQLTVIKDLKETYVRGVPQSIGLFRKTKDAPQKVRIFPQPAENMAAPDWMVTGTYKTRPTKITPTTLQTAFIPWDDLHFAQVCEVFKWAAWNIASDPRAGGVEVQKNGNVTYTGQYAIMMDAIDQMAENEGLELGYGQIAPREALVTGTNYVGPYGPFWGM